MTDGHTDEGRPLRTIRIFPDYANTVVWISEPIHYEEARLSAGLLAELESWEQSYYDSLNPEFEWVSEAAARAFTEEGTRLAGLVSAEVGPDFSVEFASYEDTTETVHIRAETSAQNPSAEKAFAQLFEETEAAEREAAEYFRNNPNAEWIAYAPLSGTVFEPNPGREAEASPDEDRTR